MTSDLTVTTTSCNTDVTALPTQRGVHFPASWNLGLAQVKASPCSPAFIHALGALRHPPCRCPAKPPGG